MLMTHSNMLFTMFTTASMIAFYEFVRSRLPGRPTRTDKRVCAQILGVFNGIVIAIFYAISRRFAWRDLLFFPIGCSAGLPSNPRRSVGVSSG
jgi:hypothetical protein